MGLPIAPGNAAAAAGKSLVFAVSGAGTGEGTGRHVKEALLGYGMMNQVRDFAGRVKSGEILRDLGARHFTIARLPTKIPQFAAVGLRLNPAYFYHEGHPSTAVHRIVGKMLFDEIAAHQPAPR